MARAALPILLCALLGTAIAFPGVARDDAYNQGMAAHDRENREAAYPLLQQACEAGDQAGCDMQGRYLAKGWGVPRDTKRALVLTEGACEAGVARGCLHAGFIHREEARGSTAGNRTAYGLFSRGCELGNANACHQTAVHHLAGTAVERDPERAAELFERACTGGHTNGCVQAGLAHAQGHGVPVDRDRALDFFQRGCSPDARPLRSCLSLAFHLRRLAG